MKLLSRPEELVLLAVWRLKDNAYCVTIRRQISEVTGKDWSFGAVYVPLDRLEKKKYISSNLGEPTAERGGRSKRFYSLTPDGVDALLKVKEIENAMWEGIEGLSLDNIA
ncbi:PadR family transcriptional regulator [candidate division KSB1 bacterium]